MRPGRLHTLLYWAMRGLQIAAIFVLVVLTAAPFIGLDAFLPSLEWLLEKHGKAINAGLAALLGALEIFLKAIGRPWIWECVKGILSTFQRDIFREAGDGALSDHHRVTLYRYQTWCLWPKGRGRWYWPWGQGTSGNLSWPWSGWLVPVVRAGPDTAGSTVFLCAGGQDFDGVCGAAYSQQSGTLEIKASSLPDITPVSTSADIIDYAKRTFVPEGMVIARIKANRPCARYFLAHRVEVQSVKWGVLMIDCRSEGPDKPTVANHRFGQIRDALDHLLRRA